MKVVIGLSGGVDSSVAAYLLKKEGYEVIGVCYKMLDDFDIKNVEEVAKELDIKLYVEDIREEFKKEIIDNFINDYKNGLTPNPCVNCNKKIKFKYLYESMIKYNADYIATGHYAKIKDGFIYKGDDLNKDQSYFLYQLDKNIINKLLLPLSNLTKEEVRQLAIDNNLITAKIKDSFDVCFIKDKFKTFIQNICDNDKGNIINIDNNKVIGVHNGLFSYTIGQRRGINVGGNESRLFVVGKDISKNILYTSLDTDNLYSNECIIKDVILNEKPSKCSAKFRYRQEDVPVTLKYIDDKVLVCYEKSKSVTPGQSCVFYIDDKLIGGGVIEEVRKDNKKLWFIS